MRVAPQHALRRPVESRGRMPPPSFMLSLLGCLYLVASTFSSTSYLFQVDPYSTNDLWWINYTVSGYQAFVVDLFNSVLAVQSTGVIELLAPRMTLDKTYDAPQPTTEIHHLYVHRLIMHELTSIEYAVATLRTLDAASSLWVATQYCWVDFDQEFEVAHTVARQQRCLDQYHANGAVYLETVLRNQNWTAFMKRYGRDGGEFDVAIHAWLTQVPRGQAWLATTSIARDTTTVGQEIAYWRAHDIQYYQLQWQNSVKIGISESIALENALGLQYDLVLKKTAWSIESGTSMVMYWNVFTDMFILSYSDVNRSLIRSAENSFAQPPVFSFEEWEGYINSDGTCVAQAAAFRSTLGPFLAVDMFYVAVPPPLLHFLQAFLDVLYTNYHTSVEAISTHTLFPTPPAWSTTPTLVFYGGNPMCLNGGPLPYVQDTFGFHDLCDTQSPLNVTVEKYSAVFAALAMGRQMDSVAICSLQPASLEDCHAMLERVVQATASIFQSPTTFTSLVKASQVAISQLNVSLVQFASSLDDDDVGSNYSLLHQPLLDDDSAWSFYGWLMLFEWTQGKREVVAFEGDVATLVLISALDTPVVFPSTSDPIPSISRLLYYLVVYTSIVLGALALGCLVMALVLRFHVVGSNLFWFNRIVGFIWVGRPLLLLRGFTATLILSTSQVMLVESLRGHSRFQFVRRSTLTSMVVAGEATWILYSVEDFLTVAVGRLTKMYGPWSCFVAWAALVWIDVSWPVLPTASVNLHCTSDMDRAVQCASGVLRIGRSTRLGLILIVLGSVQVGVAILGHTIRASQRRPPPPPPPTRHLLGVADLYFGQTDTKRTSHCWELDHVSCLMAGLVPWTWQLKPYTFDVKVWAVQRGNAISAKSKSFAIHVARRHQRPSTLHSMPNDEQRTSAFQCLMKRLIAGLGLLYAVGTIVGSVSYLQVSEVNIGNDLFWVGFNTTLHHVFIAAWLNRQLILGVETAPPTIINTNAINQDAAHDISTTILTSPPNYGALMQFSELDSIETTIAGLRNTDACLAPWIFTQYCFVDFKQRWDMANSAARQKRCQTMVSNGAVFLESVLRNIRFAEFDHCWGQAFDVSIAFELRQSTGGQTWLATIASETKPSIAVEVALWQSYGIGRFETQWQNFKRIGLVNHYTIVNAFGAAYPFVLQFQNTEFRVRYETSFKMYWGLANDFMAVVQNSSGIGGHSLIRSSGRFAFQNTSMEGVLVQNGTLSSPLANIFTILTAVVGPYGSIDVRFVPCPVQAKDAIRHVLTILRTVLAQGNVTQTAYKRIPWAYVTSVPKAWSDMDFISVGGSPLCPESSAGSVPVSQGLVLLLSWDIHCRGISVNTVAPTEAVVVSAVLAALRQENMAQTCRGDFFFVDRCLRFLPPLLDFVDTFLARHLVDFAAVGQSATTAIQALNIELIQFGFANATSPLQFYRINILDPSEVGFTFSAWIFLYDWAHGLREAVTLEGDRGSLTLLTAELNPILVQPNVAQVPAMFASYLRNTVVYITVVMIALASTMIVYACLCRGHFEVLNLFQLQRVGASVWCGRPLLLIRSLTAVALLSTSTVQLVTSGTISYFEVEIEPWYKTVLAANEVTWMVAVVNDVAIGLTQDYTRYYAFVNTVLVWVATVALSFAMPVTPTITIDKQCHLAQVDFQVVCASGSLSIGHVARLGLILGLVMTSNVVCYIVARAILHHPFRTNVDSIFVYAGARYLFVTSSWVYGDVYFMDRMSAVLNGILTIRWGTTMHGLDVKLWRAFHVDVSSDVDIPPNHPLATPAKYALPLSVHQP
ncbi:Aste57867_8115 [Aphanomyces stellatus]|uniref:Aste57867_8115 protein n=1 Tax=Aphanomyces stellatus TaxID=120398 RepID=A0A485KJE4_9STRA|nr:hypothetical protein As57867_008085 [Aphanomyces stellatus]VFT85004.1 Aste57867_8115 [Aphanomyces stellatus]